MIFGNDEFNGMVELVVMNIVKCSEVCDRMCSQVELMVNFIGVVLAEVGVSVVLKCVVEWVMECWQCWKRPHDTDCMTGVDRVGVCDPCRLG
jgi:hypothetical protein